MVAVVRKLHKSILKQKCLLVASVSLATCDNGQFAVQVVVVQHPGWKEVHVRHKHTLNDTVHTLNDIVHTLNYTVHTLNNNCAHSERQHAH